MNAINNVPLLPVMKINVQFEWICPGCNKPSRSEGFMELKRCNMVCPHCLKEVYIDARLSMNNRSK